ncbi:hypothetical protein [Flavihumibacter sp. CACIAM 22H1]|uniref:hypothetical protein n=1 Tax=Flavihumibacter sp. CACIAM 22H1 TaxID=1812911 RepID=UPI000A9241D1|nr:hypothetical protein [Flavihumibacter sp. CACIAM 22H1]
MMEADNDSMKPAIRISGLNKFYGAKQVLKDINLSIYPGQVIGYIGRTAPEKVLRLKFYAD